MKKMLWLICLLMFATAVSFSPVWAEEKKADAKKEAAEVKLDKKQTAEYSKKADMFVQVVAHAEAEKDPVIMLSAVKIMDDLPFKSIEKPAVKGQEATLYERDALLKQAKEFAVGDTELLAVIAKVESAPEKTEVRGHHGGGHGGYYGRRHHEREWDRPWRYRHGHWGFY